MLGINFPISEYYRQNILDARTISRGGPWWTAVLLIQDPKSNRPFVALYRWQKTESGWKARKRFTFRKQKDIQDAFAAVSELGKKLVDIAEDEHNDDSD